MGIHHLNNAAQEFTIKVFLVCALFFSCTSKHSDDPVVQEMSKAIGMAETSELMNSAKRFTILLKQNPAWGEGWIYLGRSLAAQGKYLEGAAAVEKGGNLGKRRSTVWLEACSMALNGGNQKLAASYLQKALHAKVHRKWLIMHNSSYDGFLDLGDYLQTEEARGLLKSASKLRPSLHPDLIAIDRKLDLNSNATDETLKMVEEYSSLVMTLPENGEMFYLLGKKQLLVAQWFESLSSFHQAKKMGYQSPSVMDGWLAHIYAHLGSHDSAFEYLERNLASNDTPDWILNPGEFDPLYNDPRWNKIVNKYRVTSTPAFQIPERNQGTILWPTKEWIRTDPGHVGVDKSFLLDAVQYIEKSFSNVTSLLLVKNGQLVFERYFHGYTDKDAFNIKSTTKSFTSILAGIMYDHRILPDLNTPIIDIIPEYFADIENPLTREITLKHLLTMTTGLDYSENGTASLELFQTGDYARLGLKQNQRYKPGEMFEYSSPVTHLLAVILAKLCKQDLLSFAQEHLFDPLGIQPEAWAQDLQGFYLGDSELRLRPRDLAKFGLLILRGGNWEGKSVVSKEWIGMATDIQVPVAHNFHSSYGFQFWLFNVRGHRVIHARGYAGQKCVIIPSLDIVCVMTSEPVLPENDPGFIIGEWIVPSVEKSDN